MTTPLTTYLPFNMDCLRDGFAPAKRGAVTPEQSGYWLIVQDQGLVVPEGAQPWLLEGTLPSFVRRLDLGATVARDVARHSLLDRQPSPRCHHPFWIPARDPCPYAEH
jgi:hypothetical protein